MSPSKTAVIARAKHGLSRFVMMFLYLFVIFTLFQFHEYIVLTQHHLPYTRYGFAIVNALILAKVMLVADEFRLGDWFPTQPLLYPILIRSILFAAVFIVFDIAEKVITGLFEGQSLADSIPSLGSGGVLGSVLIGAILTVALTPFFAFAELSKILGPGVLRSAFLTERFPLGQSWTAPPSPELAPSAGEPQSGSESARIAKDTGNADARP